MLLFAGDVVGTVGGRLVGRANFLAAVLGGIALLGIAGLVSVLVGPRWRRRARLFRRDRRLPRWNGAPTASNQ
jgi:hypothetical protein